MDFVKLLKMISALVAAGILGNWYLSEYRKARMSGLSHYRAYLTLPGLLIIFFIILLPLIFRFI